MFTAAASTATADTMQEHLLRRLVALPLWGMRMLALQPVFIERRRQRLNVATDEHIAIGLGPEYLAPAVVDVESPARCLCAVRAARVHDERREDDEIARHGTGRRGRVAAATFVRGVMCSAFQTERRAD